MQPLIFSRDIRSRSYARIKNAYTGRLIKMPRSSIERGKHCFARPHSNLQPIGGARNSTEFFIAFAGWDVGGRKRGTIIRIPFPTRFTSGFSGKIRLEIVVDAGRSFFFDSSMKWPGKKGARGEGREERRGRERNRGMDKAWRFERESRASLGIGNREGKKCNLSKMFWILMSGQCCKNYVWMSL